jgi:hypothetical protein
MKLSRAHIALLIGIALVIITINAAQRVRYFGEQERRWRAEASDGGPEAAATAGGSPIPQDDAGGAR